MMRMLATQRADDSEVVERVVLAGDLARLAPDERVAYYAAVCRSLGLNPLTRPFEYITLNGKLTLYATRGATDQLRELRGVSLRIVAREQAGDVYSVTARATVGYGHRERTDESTGVVAVAGLKGADLANALMKAETKAKRRVTLSIVGLGWLDESELETLPEAPAPPTRAPNPLDAAAATSAARAPATARNAVGAREGGLPMRTASEFWAAAHALLGCSRGQVATEISHRLGQEAAAYVQQHGIGWAELYVLLEANVVEGEPIPGAPEPAEPEPEEPPPDEALAPEVSGVPF